MNSETFTLPTHWASAFINGDFTGYDDEECEQMLAFERQMIADYGVCWCLDVEEDSYFTSQHDATHLGVLACDVSEYSFDITAQK